jgi:acetyl esterase
LTSLLQNRGHKLRFKGSGGYHQNLAGSGSGEKVELPPVLYIQGTADMAHPKADRERFVESYRRAGGHLELELFEGEAEGFVGRNSNSPNAPRAIEKIIDFVHRQLG